jgi:hypothetical protein
MKKICLTLLFVGLLSVPNYSGAEISAPTSVTATEGTYSDTIIVTWNEVPGATYEVWRDFYEWCQGAIPCEPEFILYGEVFNHEGIWDRRDILPFGQVFEYRIKACVNDAITNEYICSDFSLPAYGYVLEDAPILPGPTGVTATEGTYSNAIIISWDPVPDASGYELWEFNSTYYSCNEPKPCEPKDVMLHSIDGPMETELAYGLTRNLSFDKIYEFGVKAFNDDSTSDFSLPAYGFVQKGAPTYDFIDFDGCVFKNCGDGFIGAGGGGIFGDIIRSSVIGYHLDGFTTKGVQVYMPVTPGFKALKGAQEYVRSFAPDLAEFVRKCFDFFEQKADANKEGLLYNTGTYVFPLLGKIAEKSLELIGEEKFIDSAYLDTTISIEEFEKLKIQGQAIAPKVVKEIYPPPKEYIIEELN